jgi:hypothetical protein
MKKALIIFGLVWFLAGGLLGIYLAAESKAVYNDMEVAINSGDSVKVWDIFNSWRGRVSTHTHALSLSLLAIIIALTMSEMRFSEKTKLILGIVLILGVALSGIFSWFYFEPLMGLGYILILVTILMSIVGVVKGKKKA